MTLQIKIAPYINSSYNLFHLGLELSSSCCPLTPPPIIHKNGKEENSRLWNTYKEGHLYQLSTVTQVCLTNNYNALVLYNQKRYCWCIRGSQTGNSAYLGGFLSCLWVGWL